MEDPCSDARGCGSGAGTAGCGFGCSPARPEGWCQAPSWRRALRLRAQACGGSPDLLPTYFRGDFRTLCPFPLPFLLLPEG